MPLRWSPSNWAGYAFTKLLFAETIEFGPIGIAALGSADCNPCETSDELAGMDLRLRWEMTQSPCR